MSYRSYRPVALAYIAVHTSCNYPLKNKYVRLIEIRLLCCFLVFTSDGVVVGVIIRSVARYDLVKIKPTESEAEHRFCLRLGLFTIYKKNPEISVGM